LLWSANNIEGVDFDAFAPVVATTAVRSKVARHCAVPIFKTIAVRRWVI
jgi:hypothetical protein